LSVGSGFRFGCGFTLAAAIVGLSICTLLSLALLIAVVAGADPFVFLAHLLR
jgi:hypothetical protein